MALKLKQKKSRQLHGAGNNSERVRYTDDTENKPAQEYLLDAGLFSE